MTAQCPVCWRKGLVIDSITGVDSRGRPAKVNFLSCRVCGFDGVFVEWSGLSQRMPDYVGSYRRWLELFVRYSVVPAIDKRLYTDSLPTGVRLFVSDEFWNRDYESLGIEPFSESDFDDVFGKIHFISFSDVPIESDGSVAIPFYIGNASIPRTVMDELTPTLFAVAIVSPGVAVDRTLVDKVRLALMSLFSTKVYFVLTEMAEVEDKTYTVSLQEIEVMLPIEVVASLEFYNEGLVNSYRSYAYDDSDDPSEFMANLIAANLVPFLTQHFGLQEWMAFKLLSRLTSVGYHETDLVARLYLDQ